jgi:hypothetical protein
MWNMWNLNTSFFVPFLIFSFWDATFELWHMMVAYGIPGGCSYAAVSLRITANGRRIVTLAHLPARPSRINSV